MMEIWATAKAGSMGGVVEMGLKDLPRDVRRDIGQRGIKYAYSVDGIQEGRMQIAVWRGNARFPYYAVAVLLGLGLVMFEYHLQADQVWGVQVDHLSDL